MKKEFAILSCLIATSLMAQEEKESHHFLSPKVFYKKHIEKTPDMESYDFWHVGVGLSYDYIQKEGLNFNSTIITNLSAQHPYSESKYEISYKGIFPDHLNFYPLIGINSSARRLYQKNIEEGWDYRNRLHFGLGYEKNVYENLFVDANIMVDRDLVNTQIYTLAERFAGIKTETFCAFKWLGRLKYKFTNYAILELEGAYSRTFHGECQDISTSLAFNWGF